jgi:hypothetical protein
MPLVPERTHFVALRMAACDPGWSSGYRRRSDGETLTWDASIEVVLVRTRVLSAPDVARIAESLWGLMRREAPIGIKSFAVGRASVEAHCFIHDPSAAGFPIEPDRVAWERRLRADVRDAVRDALLWAAPRAA